MRTPLLLDAESVLRLDLGGLKLIEASAGTGKTYTISNLYLRQVLDGKMPSQILVVTFTRAATEELRGRIRHRLFQVLQAFLGKGDIDDEFLKLLLESFHSQPDRQQQLWIDRLRDALANIDEAAVSTIHSFCQRILQDYALPSLQYFDNEILVEDGDCWQSAIRDWWRQHTYTLAEHEWIMFDRAVENYDSFSRQVEEVARKQPAAFLPADTASLDEQIRSINSLEPILAGLSCDWKDDRDTLIDIIKSSDALSQSIDLPYHPQNFDSFVDRMDKFFASDDLMSFPQELDYLGAGTLYEKSKPTKRGKDAGLEHEFFHSVERFFSRVRQLLNTIRISAIRQAVEECARQVVIQRVSNQQLSYQDLIDFLCKALSEENGDRLASLVRRQFPVAMIDEFQDTDATQYNIFSALYYNQADISLTLIGDPKQAIYSFRGGDIFTYMKARHAPKLQHCVLQTNWRSQPGLVKAVNHFFSCRDDPFIYSESIEFLPTISAEINRSSFLTIDDERQCALTLWKIPRGPGGKPLNKETATDCLSRAVADEIFSLLRQDSDRRACIDGENLAAGDIAILVRTGVQGQAVRAALQARGISAVTIGKDRVFDSEEAGGLFLLLGAVVFPSNRRRLRQALASELLYFDHREIRQIGEDDNAWQEWTEQFHRLHRTWANSGFIPMFQQLLQTFGLADKLAARDQPQRRLTNLLHLGEILQQQSLQSSGIDNLLIWFQRERQQGVSEEAELRLESDRELVRIITIHKSKGLEFPVVFLPFAWDYRGRGRSNNQAVYFHDDCFEANIDLGSEHLERHRVLADRERLAEDLRLLYVALTRARSKTYLAWGLVGGSNRSGNSGSTALAYLLHSVQTPDQLSREYADAFHDAGAMDDDLASFVDGAGGDIELCDLPTGFAQEKLTGADLDDADIQPQTTSLKLEQPWRINSFSALTWDIHQPPAITLAQTVDDGILDFPAGSHVGLFLHALLEDLDFSNAIEDQCRRLVPGYAARFGLDADTFNIDIGHWLNEITNTALLQPGLTLSALSREQRLNELAFDFAVDHADIDRINRFFGDTNSRAQASINASDFRGLITGIIDLVFVFDGKFYLADYKSNFLGNRLEDYRPVALEKVMLERRYDLQLMIYSIALHRYLRHRIADYDYNRHFGGAYYLFLRAMRQRSGSDYGVYFDCPDRERIEALDALFSHSDGALAR